MKFVKILSVSVLTLAVTAAIATPTPTPRVIKASGDDDDCAMLVRDLQTGVWSLSNVCPDNHIFSIMWTKGYAPTKTKCLKEFGSSVTTYPFKKTSPMLYTQDKC